MFVKASDLYKKTSLISHLTQNVIFPDQENVELRTAIDNKLMIRASNSQESVECTIPINGLIPEQLQIKVFPGLLSSLKDVKDDVDLCVNGRNLHLSQGKFKSIVKGDTGPLESFLHVKEEVEEKDLFKIKAGRLMDIMSILKKTVGTNPMMHSFLNIVFEIEHGVLTGYSTDSFFVSKIQVEVEDAVFPSTIITLPCIDIIEGIFNKNELITFSVGGKVLILKGEECNKHFFRLNEYPAFNYKALDGVFSNTEMVEKTKIDRSFLMGILKRALIYADKICPYVRFMFRETSINVFTRSESGSMDETHQLNVITYDKFVMDAKKMLSLVSTNVLSEVVEFYKKPNETAAPFIMVSNTEGIQIFLAIMPIKDSSL